MLHKFDGEFIFGNVATETLEGPTADYRVQTDVLPGVAGERIYRLGGGPQSWHVRGRIAASTIQGLKKLIAFANSYRDGNLYTFTDSDGFAYKNCRLSDYRAIGPIEGITTGAGAGGVTCEAEGRVVCESPVNRPAISTFGPVFS